MRRLMLSLSVLVAVPTAAAHVASALPGAGASSGTVTVAAPQVPEVVAADHPRAEVVSASTRGGIATVVPLRCDGDGTSGPRVQAVYVRAGRQPDRSVQVRRNAPRWLGVANGVVARSAAGRRQLRVVHDRACRPIVAALVLPSTTSFRAIVNAMKERGYDRADRKYLVWVDAALGCGMGSTKVDSSPGLDNANNTSTGHALVYPRCWGGRAEAHELVHTLGAVLPTAPNATRYGHCRDDYDTMCYPDGPGTVMRKTCPDIRRTAMLDCSGDSYFNIAPRRGGYLSRHWNVANSAFLIGAPRPVYRPSGPSTVTARWDTGTRSLTLSWPVATVGSGGLSGHRVYADGALVATVGPRVTSAVLPLRDGTSVYRVAGFTSAGDSRNAPSVSVTVRLPQPPAEPVTPVDPTVPVAPGAGDAPPVG